VIGAAVVVMNATPLPSLIGAAPVTKVRTLPEVSDTSMALPTGSDSRSALWSAPTLSVLLISKRIVGYPDPLRLSNCLMYPLNGELAPLVLASQR
jgi:hypothetical protein